MSHPAAADRPDPEAPVLVERVGSLGRIRLNRPQALNSLTLPMIRAIALGLERCERDPAIVAILLTGEGGRALCAGGDVRAIHDAGRSGDPMPMEFWRAEYRLNARIDACPKPYLAFMDGIVMGGGMGISQGASLRVVTERTKMAMPETIIGLFPDVGGGYFLSRCPGRVGEWLALSGETIGAADAIAFKLADGFLPADQQAGVWDALGAQSFASGAAVQQWVESKMIASGACQVSARGQIDQYFSLPDVPTIVAALEGAGDDWARATAALLRKRSPLMLHVVLEQIRRARTMDLADDLRMERDMVRHCFYLRPGQSETLEGIRALAVDKDHAPKWHPAYLQDVPEADVQRMLASPWKPQEHPLRSLAG